MNSEVEQRILVVHLPGKDGLCTGCRAWWSRLTPYPCWQVDWVTSRQARSLTAALLGGARVTSHGPVLPVWNCAGCDRPWPCPTRQRELRAEFEGAPVSLALYLGAELVRASADLTWVPAGVLHRRFLGWARERPDETFRGRGAGPSRLTDPPPCPGDQ